ncbi:ornithine decarboxylase antizyme-domain-containing protein [Lactarius hatsudake]|nr:ornithine decarboxylase antizyme-domain-containing protein [Lactarius hatsudake]
MSNSTYLSLNKPISSLCPTNGRQTVGDGAFYVDVAPSVLAICHVQGSDDMYYYSTTFSGGPGVRSPGCVTGGPASKHATAYNHTLYPTPQSTPEDTRRDSRQGFSCPLVLPTTQADVTACPIAPQPIPGASRIYLFTQMMTALELLTTLFPNHGIAALEYARSVSVSSLEMGISFDGVVLELPGKPKTFYVDCKNAEVVNLREGIVALLDLADEHLQCSALIIALEKASPALSSLLHALMYVGGTVVTKPDFPVDPAYVLVGLEI